MWGSVCPGLHGEKGRCERQKVGGNIRWGREGGKKERDRSVGRMNENNASSSTILRERERERERETMARNESIEKILLNLLTIY